MIGRGSARSIVPAACLLARFPAHKQNFPATRGNIALLRAVTTPDNLESLTLSARKGVRYVIRAVLEQAESCLLFCELMNVTQHFQLLKLWQCLNTEE